MDLRDHFPVLAHTAYLNAGTDGPMPREAAEAAQAEIAAQAQEGRTYAHFERRRDLLEGLRAAYADAMGADPADVAVMSSTTDGMGAVIAGMDLGPGDEVVTSDSEHPGLIGPLVAARERGVSIRAVPLSEVANAVRGTTTLVACSHVSWITGELAPVELADVGVPVLLDGAQGAGAIAVDVKALGCAAYAAAGQKWLCGADGTGMLYVDPEFGARVRTISPGFMSFELPHRGFDSILRTDAPRLDAPSLPREAVALSLSATQLLAAEPDLHARGIALAARLADALAERGRTVAPRGATTLVAWEDPDPAAARERFMEAGVVVRHLPDTPYVRASVGAWNDESDLERLLAAL